MAPGSRNLLLLGFGFAAGALAVLAPGVGRPPPSAPTPLLAPASYSAAVAAAAPSVVQVLASRAGADPGQAAGGLSLGSGVVIDTGGLILTNAHILTDATAVAVTLSDQRRLPADLLGTDPATDLALLAVDAAGLAAAIPGDPRRLVPGDVVLTLGHPWGLGQTAAVGIVSATGRRDLGLVAVEDFIQTDAAINPGSSGGALLDTGGRLLGISTAVVSGSGQAEGVGLAIPADLALAVAGRLAAAAGRPSGWLGIDGTGLSATLSRRFGLRAPHGVFVVAVAPESPAAAAGLRAGDVISVIDGTPLADTAQLSARLRARPGGDAPGDTLSMEVWRGSQRLQVRATLAGPATGRPVTDRAGDRQARPSAAPALPAVQPRGG